MQLTMRNKLTRQRQDTRYAADDGNEEIESFMLTWMMAQLQTQEGDKNNVEAVEDAKILALSDHLHQLHLSLIQLSHMLLAQKLGSLLTES